MGAWLLTAVALGDLKVSDSALTSIVEGVDLLIVFAFINATIGGVSISLPADEPQQQWIILCEDRC